MFDVFRVAGRAYPVVVDVACGVSLGVIERLRAQQTMVVSCSKGFPPKPGRLDEGRSIRNPPDAIGVLVADRRQGLRAADRLESEDVASCAAELMKLKHLGVWMLSNVETSRSTLEGLEFWFPTAPIHLDLGDYLAVMAENLRDNSARLLIVRIRLPRFGLIGGSAEDSVETIFATLGPRPGARH